MSARRSRTGPVLSSIVLLSTIVATHSARAYVHVVRRGETLASIAMSAYGRSDLEHVLVGANALDVQGGSMIAPGLRLEVPALQYQRAALGDTWAALADRWLGASNHATILAESNGTHPWLPPEPSRVFMIPYVLRHFAAADETVFDLASRYYGDKLAAWRLVVFNDLKGNDIHRGDVVLVPLVELPLTAHGEEEAAIEAAAWLPSGSTIKAKQAAIEAAIPNLYAHVDGARYVEAVALGHALLAIARDLNVGDASAPSVFAGSSTGPLATRSQRARIGKLLTEAYVALDSSGAAADACKLYLDDAAVVHLEPSTTSPKVRAACERARQSVSPR
ncbi:MAG: LysM domain-containing protein [Polyangiales bacterium]